jgi:ABC-type Co2+ transport system permease subunit
VFVGGIAGAIIGYSFATIQCATDQCQLSRGLFLWLGSLAGAVGAAVVAMLTLRALGEWRSLRD